MKGQAHREEHELSIALCPHLEFPYTVRQPYALLYGEEDGVMPSTGLSVLSQNVKTLDFLTNSSAGTSLVVDWSS